MQQLKLIMQSCISCTTAGTSGKSFPLIKGCNVGTSTVPQNTCISLMHQWYQKKRLVACQQNIPFGASAVTPARDASLIMGLWETCSQPQDPRYPCEYLKATAFACLFKHVFPLSQLLLNWISRLYLCLTNATFKDSRVKSYA